jgi:hypothetical protein
MSSKLVDLQSKIVNRLTEDDAAVPAPAPANGAITWITEIKGDLKNLIDRSLGKQGICAIVLTPGGNKLRVRDPKTGVISLVCPVQIQIQESVTINQGSTGTKIPALELVEFVMKRLNYYELSPGQRITRVELDEVPYTLVTEYPILTYDVWFNAPVTLQ